MKVVLDRAGMVAVLKGPFGQKVVTAGAKAIAAGASATAHDGPAPVRANGVHQATYSAASSVSIAHPAGLALEGKYAPLARAAAGAGFEVRGGAG